MSKVTAEMLQQMQVSTILAAAEAVHRTYPKCAATRNEVDRLERELVKAREAQEAAIAERADATEVVHQFVREYAGIATRFTPTDPDMTERQAQDETTDGAA